MEEDTNCLGIEGRGGWAEEVIPVEVCRMLKGGKHYGCKEGPWEAFNFGLWWCWDEEDFCVREGVEECPYVRAEWGRHFNIAGVVV